MTDHTSGTITIGATPQRCFDLAVAFEDYPSWADELKETKVVERDGEGRGTLVQFRAAGMGRSTRYTLRYDYQEAPGTLSWVLHKGDVMRRLDGAYHFATDGDGFTTVTYDLSVELIIPLLGFVKRRAEARIIHTALTSLKDHVEATVGSGGAG